MPTAVVINVDTFAVTALAVLSVRSRTDCPIRLIDCSRRRKEREQASSLARHLGIRFQHWPLLSHGRNLDRLFSELEVEEALLVDSDAELLDESLVPRLTAALDPAIHYGSGWLQPTARMSSLGMPWGLYLERMWLPFVLLRTAPVRAALRDGASFDHFKIYNDFPNWPRLSRMLALRYRLPFGGASKLKRFERFRNVYSGSRPSLVYSDTGAAVHQRLVANGWCFGELDWRLQDDALIHHHGVTRRTLNWLDTNSASSRAVLRWARQRIRREYAASLPEHLLPG